MRNRSANSTARTTHRPGREHAFLRALNEAAASLQQSVRSEDDIYQIFRELMVNLDFYGTLALLDDSGECLILRAVVYSPRLLTFLERATGHKAEGTAYALRDVEVSRQVVKTGQPIFLPDTLATICQIAPEATRPVVRAAVQIKGSHAAIYAPLLVKDQVLGLLNMSNKDLTANDIPAVMAFAYHISVALQNARLIQEKGSAEARYRRLFETAGDAILLLETKTARILSANNKARSLLGYAEEELLTMSLPSLFPPELAEEIEHLVCVSQVKEPRTAEYPLACAGDRQPIVRISTTCFDSGGRHLTQCSIRDITERKRAELLQSATYRIATLANSDISLQQLYRSIHAIIGELMDVSNFYIAIHDQETDMISMPYFIDETEPAPPPYKAGKGLTEYVIRSGEPLLLTAQAHAELIKQAEAEMVGSNSPIWLGVPLKSQRGTFGAIVVQHYRNAHAYTEREKHLLEFVSGQIASSIRRKQSENALKQSEERFRKIFEEGPLGMCVVGLDGQLKEVNATFCRMTGYSERELESTPVHDIFTGAERELCQRDMSQLVAGLVPYVKAERQIAKQGNGLRMVNLTASAIRDEHDQPLYLLLTLEDVTERKEAENALHHAQKMKSLGVLAGGVAHDFNNLLVAMLGQSSLALTKMAADHPARGHVTKTVNAAELASELTRQLLAYSGRGQFIMQPLDLNLAISQNLHLIEAAIPKNVRLQLELSGQLPRIEADEGQIQQVVMNLILNAAEAFASQSGIVRVVSVVRHVGESDIPYWESAGGSILPGDYVALEVSDNGPGMDAETTTRMFDPFFTTKQSGRGLGLAAVMGIVRGHKAGLHVTSELGQGTRFELIFPISRSETEPVESMSPSTQKADSLRGRILIIDDEMLVREAVTDILELEQIDVLSAENGVLGIECYRNNLAEIDLVLLDLSMPGISGEETLIELQRIDPSVRVILSSGFSKAEMSRRFEGKGLVGFVPKPYDANSLIKVISSHLRAQTNGSGNSPGRRSAYETSHTF